MYLQSWAILPLTIVKFYVNSSSHEKDFTEYVIPVLPKIKAFIPMIPY